MGERDVRRPGVVMVLESAFPTPGGGGAELQVQTLGRHFVACGLDVAVVSPRLRRGPQAAREELNGLHVHRIRYPHLRKVGGVVMLARLAVFLLRHRRHYAAIHAHIANTMAAVSCVVGHALGKPVVVKLTGAQEVEEGILSPARTDLLARCLRWGLRRATYYQAISERLAALLPAHGFDPAKVRVIPNAVDSRRFEPAGDRDEARRRLGVGDRRVALFVGRLVRQKALGFFIRCWHEAFCRRDDMLLLIVGAGELERELRSLIDERSLSRQVRLAGATSDVDSYLRSADFGVLPSSAEGLSNALLEYMAAGLPVLGSRISGTEDVVRDGIDGWLFPSLDAQELKRRLVEIADAPPSLLAEMGGRSRERVIEYAGIENVAARLADLYGVPLAPAATSTSRP